jgi:hypothetical protein
MVNGHTFTAVSPAVLARVCVALQDVLLVEGQCRNHRLSDEVMKPDNRGDGHRRGRGPHHVGSVFDTFRFPREKQNHGSPSTADLKGLEGLVQDQYAS